MKIFLKLGDICDGSGAWVLFELRQTQEVSTEKNWD